VVFDVHILAWSHFDQNQELRSNLAELLRETILPVERLMFSFAARERYDLDVSVWSGYE